MIVPVAAAAGLAALSNFVTPAVGPADALPVSQSCRITTYYKTAEMTQEVGVRSTCPGVSKWGRTSKYYEVETLQTDNGGGHHTSGPGKLPCEFLQQGCSNLPVSRF
jgi:hypothetical protein